MIHESRRDGTLAHKYTNVLIHVVFSTKERRNLIPQELHPILFALPSDVSIAKAVQTFKANSSRWLGEHGIGFAWQEGYGAFSVSPSNVDAVKHYIRHQPEHHAKRSFEDEFIALLRKSGVSFEPDKAFG